MSQKLKFEVKMVSEKLTIFTSMIRGQRKWLKGINITAAQNKEQIDTKTITSSWSVGGTIGSGVFGNFSKGSGKVILA